jgi:hypothetical protein
VADRPKIEGEIGSRDDCLEKETRFGAYSVVLKSAKGLNELLRMGLGLRTDDLYLEVHVPDAVKGAPRAVLATFKKGALELADFLSEKRLRPRWLIGVTHQNMARPAQRFLNFQVTPPSWISPRACGVGNRLNEGRPGPESALPPIHRGVCSLWERLLPSLRRPLVGTLTVAAGSLPD